MGVCVGVGRRGEERAWVVPALCPAVLTRGRVGGWLVGGEAWVWVLLVQYEKEEGGSLPRWPLLPSPTHPKDPPPHTHFPASTRTYRRPPFPPPLHEHAPAPLPGPCVLPTCVVVHHCLSSSPAASILLQSAGAGALPPRPPPPPSPGRHPPGRAHALRPSRRHQRPAADRKSVV